VIYAPGGDAPQVEAQLLAAIERAGIHGDRCPDLLAAVTRRDSDLERELATRVGAVLSERAPSPFDTLPAFGAGLDRTAAA
jgi:hypothetical protein